MAASEDGCIFSSNNSQAWMPAVARLQPPRQESEAALCAAAALNSNAPRGDVGA